MVAQPKPEPEEKDVVCPKCKTTQIFLVNRGGRLFVRGPRVVEITGYVCEGCKTVKFWHTKR